MGPRRKIPALLFLVAVAVGLAFLLSDDASPPAAPNAPAEDAAGAGPAATVPANGGDAAAGAGAAASAATAGSLVGRVVDPDGRPVPGAIVVADGAEGLRAVADADGRYRLDGLPAGDRLVAAARPGAEPGAIARVRVPDVTRLDIELPPSAVLTGIVRRKDTGEPVPGAVVFARREGFEGRARAQAVADADGRYRIDSISPGPVEMLWARAGDLGGPDALGQEEDDLELFEGVPTVRDIELVPWPPDGPMDFEYEEAWEERPWTVEEGGVRVHGTVRTAAGAPATGARVRAWRGIPSPNGVGRGAARGVPVGADGSFQFRFEPGEEPVCLFAVAPGFAPLGPRLVDVPAGADDVAVDLVIDAGFDVSGRVVASESGEPLAGAAIELRRPRGRYDPIACGPGEPPPDVVATTADDGTFRIPHAPAGRFRIEARAPGRRASGAYVRLPDEGTIDLALPPALSLGGTIRFEDGSPAAGVRLACRPTSGGEWGYAGRVAPDGSFLIRDLGPGPRLLLAERSWRAGGFLDTEYGPFEPGRRDLELRLSRGLSIAGRVLDPDGKPAEDTRVAFFDAEGKSAGGVETDESGAFEGGALRRGIYRVEARRDGFAPAAVEEIEAGTRDVLIRLEPGLTISGRVVDGNGETPLVPPRIYASPREATAPRPSDAPSAMAFPEGRFEIGGLAPGRYWLVLVRHRGDRAVLLPAEPVPAGATNVDLVYRGGEKIVGEVVDEAGAPVRDAWIHLTPSVYGQRPEGGTDRGNFVVPGLFPGVPYSLEITKEGFVTRTVEGVKPGGAPVRIVLSRGLPLRGRALAASGEPLAGIEIVLRHATEDREAHARTDARGEFRAKGLAPGRWRAAAGWYEESGWVEVDLGEVEAGATDAVLRAAR